MPIYLKYIQVLFVSILFFFCVNHFDGFDQDGVLYTLQALQRIAPERFLGDPSFMFGVQDHYSLFSPIYGLFLKVFPIDTAAFIFVTLIHSFFAFAVSLMVWKWTDHFHCKQLALPIILSFFALYAYGETRNEFVFTIKTIESCPVPRTLSAAFGFLGLAFLFQKKWIALIPFVIGTLIHPLTAGWSLPLWCIFHFPKIKIPLFCCALFFPLTIFFNIGPFCKSPDDWIKISFGEGLGTQVINMTVFLIFFFITLKKSETLQSFKKILLSVSIILGIALYWLIVELSTHHVFLHQVQTFRVQWICQILAVFILVWQCSQIWVFKIQKELNLDFWEKTLLVCLLVLWIDCAYIVPIILLSLLYTIKPEFQKRKTSEIALLVVSLCGAFFAIYQTLEIKPCLKPEYVYASKELFTGPLFAFISAMALYFACRFPKLRPIIAFLLILQFFVIMRAQPVLPKENFGLAFVLGTLVYITTCTQWNSRLVQRGFLILTSLTMIVCIVINYDHRDNQLKEKEKAMNQFVQAPPFPYISNRGKILYSATDFGEAIPRLRFLSGGYYDFQIKGGGMFSEMQTKEIASREWKIYGEKRTKDSSWENKSNREKTEATLEVLFQRDSLLNRFTELCKQGEISHLVTSMELPLAKEDSLTLWYRNEIIYLYPCNQ